MAHPKLTGAQRQQIEEMLGTASYADIAKAVGCSKSVVGKIKAELDSGGAIVHETVHVSGDLPARARARDKEEIVHVNTPVYVDVHVDEPYKIAGKRVLSETMTQHLYSELDLYNDAKGRLSDPQDVMAHHDVVQHGKLVQSAINSLAKWYGLDRGDMEDAEDEIRIVDEHVARRMTYDELCKVIECHAVQDDERRLDTSPEGVRRDRTRP